MIEIGAWQCHQGLKFFSSLYLATCSVGFNIRLVATWQQQFSASHPDIPPCLKSKKPFCRDLAALVTGTGKTNTPPPLSPTLELRVKLTYGHMKNGGYINTTGVLWGKKGKWRLCRQTSMTITQTIQGHMG